MRPRSLLALNLVVLLFLAPLVQAETTDPLAPCSLPPPPESDDGGLGGLRWYGPDRVAVHHPLLLAIAAKSDDTRIRSHVDMTVRILFEDEVLFETASLHEHDGFHTLAFTPDRPGLLVLEASEGKIGEDATYTHHVQVCEPRLESYESLSAWDGVEGEVDATDRTLHLLLSGPTHGFPMLGLFDLREPDGRLTYSGWNGHFHAMYAEYDASRAGAAEVYILPQTEATEAVWTQRKGTHWDGSGAAPGTPWDPTFATRDCRDPKLTLLTDPNTIQDGLLAWQADSDLRFALLDETHQPVPGLKHYALERLHTVPSQVASVPFWRQTVADPYGSMTVRIPDPGHYVLYAGNAQLERTTCTELVILPNTDLGSAGAAQATVSIDGSDLSVDLAAVRDDQPLPHYEFDTRVYRLATDTAPGSLVWMGKLHAHHDTVSFRLADLSPGDYELITYPSPQDQGIPPVATDDPAGFRWTFTIEGSHGVNMTDEEIPLERGLIPSVAPLLPVLLALAVLITRRRDR